MPRKRNKYQKAATTPVPTRHKVLDEIRRAGEIVFKNQNGESMSDEDLRLAIKGTEVALAYLEGRGRLFDLATNVLRRDLSVLEQYRDMRKACPRTRS